MENGKGALYREINRVELYLPREKKKQYQAAAAAAGMSFSEFIISTVDEKLNKSGPGYDTLDDRDIMVFKDLFPEDYKDE